MHAGRGHDRIVDYHMAWCFYASVLVRWGCSLVIGQGCHETCAVGLLLGIKPLRARLWMVSYGCVVFQRMLAASASAHLPGETK